ncbi:MAG: L,D-transpeptidase [Methylocystis sp.]|nr:L,D-transpeptidase [Methylocystis sp.]MBI3274893.1 L,D-transpeptidase [Methylocystis sp.]
MAKPILSTIALTLTAGLAASSAHAFENPFLALFGLLPAAAPVSTGDDAQLAREYAASTRVEVDDPTNRPPGTITIDTQDRYLYLSLPGGRALRYGVGVGRAGFTWSGRTYVGRKEAWPDWTPPAAMLKRRPDLPRHMVGGEDNPLGARAMYLYAGDRDTMFRIHGSNEPWSIGQAVSSGCIRMLNDDVTDLFGRVRVGTPVVVL